MKDQSEGAMLDEIATKHFWLIIALVGFSMLTVAFIEGY